jgi:Zn-dependent protease/CBS domain-containing protein
MFGTRWRLFRLLGIPISLDASWLIIIALLTLSLAGGFPRLLEEYFPGTAQGVPEFEYWLMGLITALAFFGCILLHELGHAVVARARGMPIRGITLFLFGGVAELGSEPLTPGTEFLMAIAGPLVSVVLAVIFGLVASVGLASDWPHPIVIVLGYLAVINGLVVLFNLLPAFPLDGGRVLRSLLWWATGSLRSATYWASLSGQGLAWFLIASGIFQFFAGNWLGGIWTGLIGLFLNSAAQSSYQQVLIRQALQGERVSRFMNPDPIVVGPALDLRHWVDDFVYRHHHRAFPVVTEGRLQGLITTQALSNIPRESWGKHTVGELMETDLDDMAIGPDVDAMEALERMQRIGASRLLVIDGARLLGLVSLKDLLRFLNLKLEVEGADKGPAQPDSFSWSPPRRDETHRV